MNHIKQGCRLHLQIILENTGKVILQFRSSKVCQNFLPVRGILPPKTKIKQAQPKPKQQSNKERQVQAITVNRPKFGFNFPAKTLRAVDFPIPFVPTNPSTCPGLGTGNLPPQHSSSETPNPQPQISTTKQHSGLTYAA